MAVTMILAGLLVPALAGLRDRVERTYSANNMRNIGMGLTMYTSDHGDRLPGSAFIRADDQSLMQEMMALYVASDQDDILIDSPEVQQILRDNGGWEGIGLLYRNKYIDNAEAFYCPSHRGDHPFERYAGDFHRPSNIIYSNYHYRGDWDREENRPIRLHQDVARVVLTDGMRTRRDFNHRVGYNSLLGDGSVFWRFDKEGRIYQMLPTDTPLDIGGTGPDVYERLWDLMDQDF